MHIHIISHTHWDREWFLNSTYTNEWLPTFFESLFAMLEKEPNYRFVLDGQTLLIEDWARELEKHGKDSRKFLSRLRNYAKEKRVFLGPYYLQPDWQLVSGEALVRNLYMGQETAKEYGSCLSVGWLLDNFGQISQAVQIHKQFGLQGIFLWRGVDCDPEDVRTEFLWQSSDGSVLPVIYLIDSYRNAMRLSENATIFHFRIAEALEKLKPFATTSNLLLMNGYDQETEPDDILPLLRKGSGEWTSLGQSTPDEYIEAVEKEHPKRPRVKGYLNSGRYISVFPGVLSSRIYLKMKNHQCQQLLERYLEPIHAVSRLTGAKQNTAELKKLWKLLLQNHPHDSICGVSVDDVHTDMEDRFRLVEREGQEKLEKKIRHLVSRIDTRGSGKGTAYVVFNPSFHERDMIIPLKPEDSPVIAVDGDGNRLRTQKEEKILYVFLPQVPGFGYASVFLLPSNDQKPLVLDQEVKVSEIDKTIENSFLKVWFHQNGTLSLHHKSTGVFIEGFAAFEDTADAGDTYNYSPLAKGEIITSLSEQADISFLEKGPLRCTVRVSLMLRVPKEIAKSRTCRDPEKIPLPIITDITLDAVSPLITFRTFLKNTAKDHRLRVLFPTGIHTNVSQAETQFDVVEHPIEPAHYDETELSPALRRVMIGAREPEPRTTFPQQSFMTLHDATRVFAVFNQGLPEYEVLSKAGTIALTLCRSVGWLARSDLVSRTGDAGPQMRTPEAQCLREMDFRYAVFPFKEQVDLTPRTLHNQSEAFMLLPLIVKTSRHGGSLPHKQAFFTLSSERDSLQVSALKPAEDGRGIILRCWNMGRVTEQAVLRSAFPMQAVWRVDLKEEPLNRENGAERKEYHFHVGPKEICTLRIQSREADVPNLGESAPMVSIMKTDGFEPLPDFSAYPTAPVLSPEDLAAEEKRAESLEEDRKKLNALEDVAKGSYSFAAQKATLERSSLEARLSVLLCKKKYQELYPHQTLLPESLKEIEDQCRELGFMLNHARIRKRTYDYLAAGE